MGRRKKTFEQLLLEELDIDPKDLPERFKPTVHYDRTLDMLILVEENCSYVSEQVSVESCIAVLRHPNDGRIVGVKIESFSQLVSGDLSWVLSLIKS